MESALRFTGNGGPNCGLLVAFPTATKTTHSRTHLALVRRLLCSLAVVLSGLGYGQAYTVEEHLDEVSKVKCESVVPKDFSCAVLFDVDPPLTRRNIDIASVVGGENDLVRTPLAARLIRGVTLILDGILYTAVYDPPLKEDDIFPRLRRNLGVPARVDGDNLFVKWSNVNEAKAKIIRREKINPNRPQPA